jgi:hypothetical protein
MSYGHAERNLALIRQLEAETRQLFGSLAQSEQEQLPEPRLSGELGGSPGHSPRDVTAPSFGSVTGSSTCRRSRRALTC